MPDAIVIGGGIVGASCAYELAHAGASVTLIERQELAAGASGRNQGLWVLPDRPALVPMARLSLATYLEVADIAPVPVALDRAPVGVLLVAETEDQVGGAREVVAHVRAHGVDVDELDHAGRRELEPALSTEVAGAWLRHEGQRVDPCALTVALGLLARERGATVRHHLSARSLDVEGEHVRGVLTDEGPLHADVTIVAAGPWSGNLLDAIGIRVPVVGARGWLVRVGPPAEPLRHLIEGGRRDPGRWSWSGKALTVRRIVEGGLPPASLASLLQPHFHDGTVLIGSSREDWVTPEPESADVVVDLLRAAARLVPSLADAPVLASGWGIRPLSADDLPIVGTVRDGLVVATGHGAEGVILGAGTARLVASIVLGTDPPYDPAPFDPLRSFEPDAV
ncbi:MAG: NAD(P)/FAD-dependent oxidoreductase [Planctomycetaceae bacterium]